MPDFDNNGEPHKPLPQGVTLVPHTHDWHMMMTRILDDKSRAMIWLEHPLTWNAENKEFRIFGRKHAHQVAATIIRSGFRKELAVVGVTDNFKSPVFEKSPFPSDNSKTQRISLPSSSVFGRVGNSRPAANTRDILGNGRGPVTYHLRERETAPLLPYKLLNPPQTTTPTPPTKSDKQDQINKILDKYLA